MAKLKHLGIFSVASLLALGGIAQAEDWVLKGAGDCCPVGSAAVYCPCGPNNPHSGSGGEWLGGPPQQPPPNRPPQQPPPEQPPPEQPPEVEKTVQVGAKMLMRGYEDCVSRLTEKMKPSGAKVIFPEGKNAASFCRSVFPLVD